MCLALALAILTAGQAARADMPLVRLAVPGPWPGVSHLIAFDGAIWFVNSEPFANFNAADVYRFAPATRVLRYERGLASQDSGEPTVFRGRLYWPFEDARSNAGLGEYAVTDGRNWQWHTFTEGEAFHVHVMKACRGKLLAGTGGWHGALQISSDGGPRWHEIFRPPDGEDGLGRVTSLGTFNDRCFFGLTAWNTPGPKLFEWRNGSAEPVAGWPDGGRVLALTAFKGALYALNDGSDGRSLWRFDGTATERLNFPAHTLPRDLAVAADQLVAISSDADGGALWRSQDGSDWSLMQRFEGERPIDVLGVGNDLYIGTYRDGGGALWGPSGKVAALQGAAAQALPPPPMQAIDPDVASTGLRRLEAALEPKPDYATYRSAILSVTLPMALTHDPEVGFALSARARGELPAGDVMTFTKHRYSYAELARWLLLHSVGLNGAGRVPVQWLRDDWNALPNDAGKYFDTPLAAIRAVARLRQNTTATLDALIARLERQRDPAWLRGDVIAALTELTDQHFGHDIGAWAAWWKEARPGWSLRASQCATGMRARDIRCAHHPQSRPDAPQHR